MDYIHIKKLEKYHPGYTDRELKWGKVYFTIIQGDPEFELIDNEVDKWRFIAMVCLELEAKKALPNTDEYWVKKFDIKNRPMSLTLQMLQSFIEVVTEEKKVPLIDKSKNKSKNKNIEEDKIPQDIYDYYKKNIKAGASADAIKSIAKLLKTGFTKEGLIGRIDAYKALLIKKPTDYIIQANNFFGEKSRYKDFEPIKNVEYMPPNPDCKSCKGIGKVQNGEGQIKRCYCVKEKFNA